MLIHEKPIESCRTRWAFFIGFSVRGIRTSSPVRHRRACEIHGKNEVEGRLPMRPAFSCARDRSEWPVLCRQKENACFQPGPAAKNRRKNPSVCPVNQIVRGRRPWTEQASLLVSVVMIAMMSMLLLAGCVFTKLRVWPDPR